MKDAVAVHQSLSDAPCIRLHKASLEKPYSMTDLPNVDLFEVKIRCDVTPQLNTDERKQEIRQIEFASALGILLVLSHRVLYDIEIDSFQVVSSRSSVQCTAVNSNPIVDDPFCLQIAVATTPKQLHIYERRNSKMELLQKLNTDGDVTAMSFSRLEDSRVYQTLDAAEIGVLCSLDGSVFVSSHFILYEVSMITVEKQADALFEHGKFDEAISLYEKKLRNPEAVFSLDNYNPDYRQCAEFLQSFGYYHCAAKMWLLARESSKAWEIWRHLSYGEFKDATFELDDVVGRIPSVTDKKLLFDVLLWLIPLSPKQCIKITVDNSLLDHKAMKEVLRGDAKLLRIYLEMIPLTDEVTKDLCNIYVNDIVAGDLSCRHRFRHLLMNISASDRCVMYDRLPLEYGVERLLCDSSLSAADILEKVVVTYRDYDAAELICSHYSSTQPDVCLRLLKFLEDSDVDDAKSRMCSLLKCMGDSVESRMIITALPESAGIDQVASFLKRAIAKKQKEHHMMRSKMCLLERRIEIDKLRVPNDKIVIKDKTICMVCKEALSSSDVLTYLRTGYVIHSKCLRYENLCPITNSVLIPPK
ncbi:unnamed protein product [Angiostrongylus costaricensis]|uniref:Vps39_2 domain-containing protein n=1 Tax=Angiostrongylus costaricensis TaxID=334426 RepID=A0A158PG61_ANGCS|nr:unnamed protein product [Angiostrongylus costaricensis]